MNKVLSYTWEILQNLVAKFVMLISKAKPLTTYKDAKVYTCAYCEVHEDCCKFFQEGQPTYKDIIKMWLKEPADEAM